MTDLKDAAALTPPTAAASGSERGRLGGAARASALGVGIIIISVSCSSEEFSPSPSTGGGGTSGTSGGTGGTGNTGGTSGTGGAGASGGTGGTGGDGGTCDTTKSPSEEACLVSDEHAVFVNALVPTTGTGTKAKPYKTIGEALTNAAGKLIVVCNTTYDEQVKVTGGVKVYGGFSCTDWSYETGKRAVVKRTSKGAALEVSGVSASVVIEDMEFSSADGSAAGESSVAAVVTGSSDVKLRRVKLAAGKGVTGTNATLTSYTYPTQASLNGNNASGIAGGAPKACTCPAGDQTIGGAGGSAPPATKGNDGFPALGGGQGGTPGSCSVGLGKDGAPATAASDATGATTTGTLVSGTWTPTGGSPAPNGAPGQGGGGGASSASGGGGGGGCGGCGGAGGPGGGGGGASIALIAVDSTVSVDAGSELVTGDAGDGGSGAAGQGGQTEIGFFGNGTALGCSGGAGGPGASGGAGGGGAGGVSIAVMWKGAAAPSVDQNAKVTLGKKGNKGTGGKAGSNDGIDGLSQQTLEVK